MKKQGFARVKGALKGKGFIIALALSIVAVGAATYYAIDLVTSDIEQEVDDEYLGVDKNQNDVPKETENTTTTAATTEAESETEQANNFFAATAPRIMPVEGELLREYSDGELVKSETLGVWQTHDGIDIAAPVGTEIKAASEGTVLEIYEDALWGIIVTIDHGDGTVSACVGLDKALSVSVGQAVQCGEVIGKLGDTNQAECKDAPHLHFEIKEKGEFIDPADWLSE